MRLRPENLPLARRASEVVGFTPPPLDNHRYPPRRVAVPARGSGAIPLPPAFFLAAQALMMAFASLVILALWRRGSKGGFRPGAPVPDESFPWFAAALGTWAIVCVAILLLKPWAAESAANTKSLMLACLLSSPVNSGFFLLALREFEFGPEIFKRPRLARDWRAITLAAVAVDALAIVAIWRLMPSKTLDLDRLQTSSIPDVAFSFVTLLLVGVSFFKSFRERQFHLLSYLSIACIGLLVGIQILEVRSFDGFMPLDSLWAVRLVSTTSFVIMFLALAFTWADSLIPTVPADGLILTFTGRASGDRNRPHAVLFGVRGAARECFMSDRIAKRLLKLAVDRKLRGDASALHIDDALETDASGLKKIGGQLGYSWEALHDLPSKRCYRLLVDPSNITIDSRLGEIDREFAAILAPLTVPDFKNSRDGQRDGRA